MQQCIKHRWSIQWEVLLAMYEQVFCKIKCIDKMFIEWYFYVTSGSWNERPKSFSKCLSVAHNGRLTRILFNQVVHYLIGTSVKFHIHASQWVPTLFCFWNKYVGTHYSAIIWNNAMVSSKQSKKAKVMRKLFAAEKMCM